MDLGAVPDDEELARKEPREMMTEEGDDSVVRIAPP
jgi:hypothetical protein